MLVGIDHLVIAVNRLEEAAAWLEGEVGLTTAPGGRHPDHGTANRLVWLGDSYLELVTVEDDARAERSWFGTAVLSALAGGGGLAAICLASDNLDADLARARSANPLVEGPIVGERQRPDGRVVRWRLVVPNRVGPDQAPFVIEHDPTAAEWTPAERAARAAHTHPIGGRVRLELLELPVEDVRRTQDRYLRTWGLLARPSLVGGGARDVAVGEQTVRIRAATPGAPRWPTIGLVVLATPGGRPAPREPGNAAEGFGVRLRWRWANEAAREDQNDPRSPGAAEASGSQQ